MLVTAEIAYYPLAGDYNQKVEKILKEIAMIHDIDVAVQPMSTLVSGDYEAVLECIKTICKNGLKAGPSVFTLRISNACPLS